MSKQGVYLVATVEDYNNHSVLFGLTLGSKENHDNCKWFLRIAKESTGFEKLIILSDRRQGLLPATAYVLPRTGHRFCLQHIMDNIDVNVLAPEEYKKSFVPFESDSEYDDGFSSGDDDATGFEAAVDEAFDIPDVQFDKGLLAAICGIDSMTVEGFSEKENGEILKYTVQSGWECSYIKPFRDYLTGEYGPTADAIAATSTPASTLVFFMAHQLWDDIAQADDEYFM
ncbi:Uncharacterized protein PHPALM_28356 [Phytophthora palmivora]|uniref:MULE transposase domain-containing protein n=1 Tax=Phytophthora palmivora TaxID=4796 RepID=A0A2P4XA98_9STRA|nr:Uncharacterized protein PHPALM_28356 [Phytophthora palmivora]